MDERRSVNAAIAEIRSHQKGATIDGIAADFSSSAGAETIISKLPAVDVLVNNVGIFEAKPFIEIPDADWYHLFEGRRPADTARGLRTTGRISFPGIRPA
jgi:NAD(P)-dependent dehydrogenase (short-subunit alcohol dehydrogenase family)